MERRCLRTSLLACDQRHEHCWRGRTSRSGATDGSCVLGLVLPPSRALPARVACLSVTTPSRWRGSLSVRSTSSSSLIFSSVRAWADRIPKLLSKVAITFCVSALWLIGACSDPIIAPTSDDRATSPRGILVGSGATQLDVGGFFGCVLHVNGSISCWGAGSSGRRRRPASSLASASGANTRVAYGPTPQSAVGAMLTTTREHHRPARLSTWRQDMITHAH
jgi:hypothetical protein